MILKDKKGIRFIYWFAYYNLDSPSVRYRGKYPLNYLKENFNVNSYFVTPSYRPNKVLYFIKAYFSALLFRKKSSLIVIQRVNSNFIYAGLLKFLIKCRPSLTFYDLDDADYLNYKPNTIYHFIKHCSAVFVGSRELMKNLKKYNKRIQLNTSPVATSFFIKKKKNKHFTIGWIGDFAGGHKQSLLAKLFPALKNISFEVKLIIIGVGRKDFNDFEFLEKYFESCPHITLELPKNIDWNDEKELQNRIVEFDIGIATLLDDELHRSKSAFKLKQYMNNGVPVLSSNLGENKYFIRDGYNGFLCTTTEQYKKRIEELNSMSESDYNELSTNARNSTNEFDLNLYSTNLLKATEY